MKTKILLLALFIFTSSFGQVTFTSIPMDKQLVGRNTSTNKGNILIKGNVNNIGVSYDSIKIDLLRNTVLQKSFSQKLTFSANLAPFDFSIPIEAELANYSVKIYGKTGSVSTLEKEADSIVAGDVYIIQGQSNAVAFMRWGSSFNENLNDFIRVYGLGVDVLSQLKLHEKWFIGQGDGDIDTEGNTGQWGIRLARLLIDSLHIPIAIFNGAKGGAKLSYLQDGNVANSNYGRLYYRLDKTGLKDYVKAFIWSQGGADAQNDMTTEEYVSAFMALKDSCKTDYPNIEKYYIFQSRNTPVTSVENFMKVKEAQRLLAFENDDITIIQTSAINPGADNTHFPYAKGYEYFADRIFPLINRDFYGAAASKDIETPMILNARLTNDTTLIVTTDAIELKMDPGANDFSLEKANGVTIKKITTSLNTIVFTLSGKLGDTATISYNATLANVKNGNFIRNTKGIEIVCFNKYPINSIVSVPVSGVSLNKDSLTLPNVGDTEQLIATIAPANADIKTIVWTSGNTSIINVSNSGLLTAVAKGTAKIFVKSIEGGFSDSCVVTILNGVSPKYTLSVTNGTGSGNYASGTVVNISANAPVTGKIFDKWTGDVTGIANVNNASTTITMPVANTNISATYKNISADTYVLSVASGTGSGSYTEGEKIVVSANTAPSGKVFDKWTGDVAYLKNETDSINEITMPAKNISITATYIDKLVSVTDHESLFTVYPNPASNVVTIKSNNDNGGRLRIFNASGICCIDCEITTSEYSIMVSGWPTGLYFVKCNDVNGKTRTAEFIKQ